MGSWQNWEAARRAADAAHRAAEPEEIDVQSRMDALGFVDNRVAARTYLKIQGFDSATTERLVFLRWLYATHPEMLR